MTRMPRCRVCETPGGWICPACDILEKDAKANHTSLRKMGMIDDDFATAIRRHETTLTTLKGSYG